MNYLQDLQKLSFSDINAMNLATIQLHLVGIEKLTP